MVCTLAASCCEVSPSRSLTSCAVGCGAISSRRTRTKNYSSTTSPSIFGAASDFYEQSVHLSTARRIRKHLRPLFRSSAKWIACCDMKRTFTGRLSEISTNWSGPKTGARGKRRSSFRTAQRQVLTMEKPDFAKRTPLRPTNSVRYIFEASLLRPYPVQGITHLLGFAVPRIRLHRLAANAGCLQKPRV